MRQGQFKKAHPALTEALKQRSDDWRILENLITVCLSLGRWREAVHHMDRLLGLRSKSGSPLFVNELRQVVCAVAESPDLSTFVGYASEDGPSLEALSGVSPLIAAVDRLLDKCALAVPGDAALWDIIAVFSMVVGRHRRARDCRMKQVEICSSSL